MWLFGGVDGGGSKTALVVVDEQGQEVGRRQIGSANYRVWTTQGLSPADAAARVAGQITGALAEIAKNGRLVTVIAGLSGADVPEDFKLMTEAFINCSKAKGWTTDWQVVNDVELLLYGLPDSHGTGLALVSGTGSIAAGRDVNDNAARAGGWGFLFGDEGSGYFLGRGALQAVAQAADKRGPATVLTDRILAALNINSPQDLITTIYQSEADRNSKIARLAELVLLSAAENDAVALDLVREAGLELAKAVLAVYRQLDFGLTRAPALALGGSLLVKSELLRREVLGHLEKEIPLREIVRITDPALAAALSARQISAVKIA